jgi:polyphosphate kinase 2 (PPK2 family)
MGVLDDLDLSKKLSREEEAERLESAWRRLTQLRLTLGGLIGEGELGPPVCAAFEGWDASGKGGAIKRLVAPMDPRHVRVVQFAAPTHDEKRHHFLWRFWPSLPGWGGMAVFDRTWYGRVLVERVEGFASKDEWTRAYDEAVEDMIARTSVEPHAPWHLIPGDSKRYGRVAVIDTVIKEIEAGMRRHGMEPPPPIDD